MPNQRSKDQTLIALALDKRLLDLVDKARGSVGRSAWIREAIAEELKRLGRSVEPEMVNAPDRTKIDRKPDKPPQVVRFAALGVRKLDLDVPGAVVTHAEQEREKKARKRINSKQASDEERKLLAGALRAAREHESPERKQKAGETIGQKGEHVESARRESTAKLPAPQGKAQK